MKSFRLDSESVKQVRRGWPLLLILIALGALLAWLTSNSDWFRVLVPLMFGLALVPQITGQLRQKYPTAKWLWLLSVGIMTSLVAVLIRMAFPSWQSLGFNLSWLSVAFFSILTFVIINRGNKDLMQ